MVLKANHTHSRFALHRCLDQRYAFDAEAATQFQGNVAFLHQLFCYVHCGVIRWDADHGQRDDRSFNNSVVLLRICFRSNKDESRFQ